MNYFKVGQTVYSYHFGSEDLSGIVSDIDETEEYPIEVTYIDRDGDSCNHYFTLDGYWRTSDYLPSLSQTPLPKIELVPLQEKFEAGELVWCQIVKGEWDVRYYSHSDDGQHYVYPDQKKNGTPIFGIEIRKFTDNPLI